VFGAFTVALFEESTCVSTKWRWCPAFSRPAFYVSYLDFRVQDGDRFTRHPAVRYHFR